VTPVNATVPEPPSKLASASIFDHGAPGGWESYSAGFVQIEDEPTPANPPSTRAPNTNAPAVQESYYHQQHYSEQKPTSNYVQPIQDEPAPVPMNPVPVHQQFSEETRPSSGTGNQPLYAPPAGPPPPSAAQFQMDVGYIISDPAGAASPTALAALSAPPAATGPANVAPPVFQEGKSVHPSSPPQGWPEQSAVNFAPHSEAKPAFAPDEAGTAAPFIAAPPPVQAAVPVAEEAAVEEKTAEQLAAEQKLAEEDATIERLQELEPFYQDSITRFIVMIEAEAAASTDQEKLKIFKDFMEQEYFIRGQRYPLAIGDPPSRPGSTMEQTTSPAVLEEAKQSPPEAQHGDSHATVPPAAPAAHIVSPVHSPPATYQQLVQTPPIDPQVPVAPPQLAAYEGSTQQPAIARVPTRSESTVQHEPVQSPPAFQQSANVTHSESAQEEPIYHAPPKAPSPAPAAYKAFNPSLATENRLPISRPMSMYSPINPPVSPRDKPASPRPESAYVGGPSYVPYQPGFNPRRNTMPVEPAPAKPTEGYTAFRPGGGPAPPNAQPDAGHSSYAPLRRVETTIDPSARPHFTKDETFLPVREQAADNFFPSFTEHPEEEESVPAIAPLKPSPPITQELTRLLPPKGSKRGKSQALEDIKKRVTEIAEDFSFIDKLASDFEKREATNRRVLEEARRKRQEEHSDYVDRLFSDNEIGYGDIGDLDEEFNKKEQKIRKEEEKAEYDRYVKEVFEPAYNQLQDGIKGVMDLHFHTSGELLTIVVAGRDRWMADGRPEHEAVLQLLVRLDGIAERRHSKVHETIVARDRKFRKTVTEPLRAVNDIKKMSAMAKHFDESERKL
jgi:hypothetical protein